MIDSATRALLRPPQGPCARPRQAALIETLLPRLALDLAAPAPGDLRALFAHRRRRGPARDRLRRRRASDRAGRAPSRHRLHRRRAVRQRHGEGAGRDRRRMASPISGCIIGDATDLLGWLPDGFARARRPALSRPVAEAAALEAPFRAGRRRRRDRAGAAARRRIPLRQRYCRLCRLDAGRLLRSPDFDWTAERADDWRQPWPGFPGTRYEAKAKREGRTPCYLIFRKRATD